MENEDRWQASIAYRSEDGVEVHSFNMSELEELHDIVEKGPHWDTIISIEVKRINALHPALTLEQARAM